MMATILITGGTGMIGKTLSAALLNKGYDVIVLTRNLNKVKSKNEKEKIDYAEWDPEKQIIDENAISKSDHIIHLSGANVGEKRWTKRRKKEILISRIDSSNLIVESLKRIPNHIKTVVSASAIGYYGPDRNKNPGFTETDNSFTDFLGNTCKQWEESMEPVKQLGRRLVVLRTGIVLSNEGGFLREFLKPLRFGLATVLGNGKQIISWIHIDDLVNLYIYAIENEKISGVYNAVAPNPVSNKAFVISLAREKNKFFIPIRVPSFFLKMVLGEMSIEVLKSTTVSCDKIFKTGFVFASPNLSSAIANL